MPRRTRSGLVARTREAIGLSMLSLGLWMQTRDVRGWGRVLSWGASLEEGSWDE